MLKLLVIADDFTGALDSGVQFAKRGIPTAVYTDEAALEHVSGDIQVAVVDSESRHLSPEEAYQRVRRIAGSAADRQVSYCYKKVDSTLRGNIGSELAAAMDGFGSDTLCFAPAYPKLGRTTRNGIHYYNGVPIADTVFGKDPFEPVACSDIPAIIHKQSERPVRIVKKGEPVPGDGEKGVMLFDCEGDGDFEGILGAVGESRLLGGSAGFAEHLPEIIPFERDHRTELPSFENAVVVSGSVNPITIRQMEVAREAGLPVFWLTEPEKFDLGYPDSAACGELVEEMNRAIREQGVAMLSISGRAEGEPGMEEQRRGTVCENLGRIVERLLVNQKDYTLVVFGGDTAIQIINRLGGGTILPVLEIDTGVVLSRGTDRSGFSFMFVTKSGGFGEEDTVLKILDYLRSRKNA